MLNKNKDIVFVIILLIVNIFLHFHWFLGAGYVTHGDTGVFVPQTIESIAHTNFFIWNNTTDIGSLQLTASNLFFQFLYPLLYDFFGWNYDISLRILLLIPIVVVGSVFSYLFVWRVVGSSLGAFLGSLVLLFNTYTLLIHTGHLFIAMAHSLLFVVLFLFLEKKYNLLNIACLGLVLLILSWIEFRIYYITFFILGFLFLCRALYEKNWKNFGSFIIIQIPVFLGNIFWIIPFVTSGSIIDNPLFNRGLFGNQYFDIVSAISLYHRFWSNTGVQAFTFQDVPWFYGIFSLLVFLGYLLCKGKRWSIPFLIIGLLGIFLTKQSGEPFANMYQWLYDYFPGFSAFRESSKFYILTMLSYAVGIAYLILFIQERGKRVWKYMLIGFTIFLTSYNVIPYVNGDIDSLFKERVYEKDYQDMNAFLENDKTFSRILWLPAMSRWGAITHIHPSINASQVVDSLFKDFLFSGVPSWQQTMSIFQSRNTLIQAIQRYNIGYFVIPIDQKNNGDDIFVGYNKTMKDFQRQIEDKDYIGEILHIKDFGNLRMYVVDQKYKVPHITSDNPLQFTYINPTEYRVQIRNIKDEASLFFFESYNSNWKIYLNPYEEFVCEDFMDYQNNLISQKLDNIHYVVQPFDTFEIISQKFSGVTIETIKKINPEKNNENLKIGEIILIPHLSETKKISTRECISHGKDFFQQQYQMIGRKDILEDSHKILYGQLNQWNIHVDNIKNNFPSKYYKENEDGSINIDITIYFKPQNYFYIGLFISGFSFLFLVIFIGTLFILKNKNITILGNKK